jgi:Fe2+ transport system protein FeoA
VVCIKQLSTAPDVTNRLRELGFCEEQRIKLVARQSSFICQVCNARLAISKRLADSIMVETVPAGIAEA